MYRVKRQSQESVLEGLLKNYVPKFLLSFVSEVVFEQE